MKVCDIKDLDHESLNMEHIYEVGLDEDEILSLRTEDSFHRAFLTDLM